MMIPQNELDSKTLVKKTVIKSVSWLSLRRILVQLILTSSNLVLVRLLFPQDFGAFAIISFLTTIFGVFTDVGFGRSLVQKKEEPDKVLLRSVWWIQVGLAVTVAAILWVASPYLIHYYSGQLNAQAVDWLRWMGLSQILTNMYGVSGSLLERHLLYSKIVVAEVCSLFFTQLTTILFALSGLGMESFVLGSILGKGVTLGLFSYFSPWEWGFSFSWDRLKSLLAFGAPFQTANWLGIINSSVIPIFLGRFPGPGGYSGSEAVGFVTWAAGVAVLPVAFCGIIDQILFPLISRVRQNRELSKKTFEKALSISAVVTLLGAAMLFALAPYVISIIYTPSWFPALISLRLAIIQSTIVALSSLVFSTLLAFGEAKFFRNMQAMWAVMQWILSVPLVLGLGFWGLNLAGLIVSLTSIYAFVRLQKHIRIPYFKILKEPLLAAILTFAVVWYLSSLFVIENIFILILLVILGGIFYLSVLIVLMKDKFLGDFRMVWGIIFKFWYRKDKVN